VFPLVALDKFVIVGHTLLFNTCSPRDQHIAAPTPLLSPLAHKFQPTSLCLSLCGLARSDPRCRSALGPLTLPDGDLDRATLLVTHSALSTSHIFLTS